MPNARDHARAVLSDRPIPVASVHEVLPYSAMGSAGRDRSLRLVREFDPDGEEFGVRGGMGGPWLRVTKDAGGAEGSGSSGPGGLPGGPWVYLKTGATNRGEGGLRAALRRAVLILASSADVSSAASARWTGLVLEARRVSRRLIEVDALPG
jgi:hypothetical protein